MTRTTRVVQGLRIARNTRRAGARLLLAAAAGVAAAASAVALLATSAWLISRAAQHPPVLVLMVAIVAVRAFGLGRGVLRYVERLLAHDSAYRLLGDVRADAYRRLERLAPGGLSAFRSGDLLARLVADVDAVLDVILRVALPVAAAGITGAATAVFLGLVLPAAGVATAVGVGLALVVVPWLVARSARAAERAVAPERGRLATATTELLDGAPDLLAYGATGPVLEHVRAGTERLRRAERRSAWSAGLGSAGLVLAVGAACWVGLAVGVPAVAGGRLDPVLLAVVALVPLALADVFAPIPAAALGATRARPALARLTQLRSAPEPVAEPEHPLPLPPGPHHLRVDDLAVRWSADAPWVFTGVNLDLPPGRRIAVVGPSGCGKSTLAQALVRFVEPGRGRISLDGVDVRRFATDDVRTVVSLCAQDAHIFDTTLAENVRLARPGADDADVRQALERARLLDRLESFPAGIHTRVGEHGERLSGGERQRLALARCLLAGTPVVAFDEPTEHLAEPDATALTRDLLAATADRTVILVTHRAVPADLVDEVLDLGPTVAAR
ncbi:thiol reductant ABC exporter subunit CydC [Actinopolymorpha singaporensis]|uniref:ATP-binding cassette, subfamily C, CydC n=1 Tax=Actinopolymorpha singaporensis TaxID=117157 RepID=A0A1H1Y3K4_9ACTN|nr:thiol reductant ABC exporter subunit CydC [Actinopolymorpha singaporensis]SDT15952.1 ATP-binding cassette, subfamily C, CydC [Actinopolymorpha singaporensis]